MADRSFLDWPFFDARHQDLAERLTDWARTALDGLDHGDTDGLCIDLVNRLGKDGWLKHSAVDPRGGRWPRRSDFMSHTRNPGLS